MISQLCDITCDIIVTQGSRCYLIWLRAVDYMIEELNVKFDNSSGKQLYEDSMKERNKTIYNSVELKVE